MQTLKQYVWSIKYLKWTHENVKKKRCSYYKLIKPTLTFKLMLYNPVNVKVHTQIR